MQPLFLSGLSVKPSEASPPSLISFASCSDIPASETNFILIAHPLAFHLELLIDFLDTISYQEPQI